MFTRFFPSIIVFFHLVTGGGGRIFVMQLKEVPVFRRLQISQVSWVL